MCIEKRGNLRVNLFIVVYVYHEKMISYTGNASTSHSLEDHNSISIGGTLIIEITRCFFFHDEQFMAPKIIKTKKVFYNG